MPLLTNSPSDIEQYVGELLTSPMYFPPYTASTAPTSLKWRYRAIYITSTSKPAWMDSTGTWRYADGTAI